MRGQDCFWEQSVLFVSECYLFHSSPSQLCAPFAIREAQGSQSWSEKAGTFVCCFVLHVPFEAFKTMAFTHYHQRCGGGPEHRHPSSQGEKMRELCILLIFVNAKCISSGDLRFHIIMHQKIRGCFSSEKVSLIATVTYCFCVANQTAWKKSTPRFFCKSSTNCDHYGSTWQFILMNF